MVLVGCAGAIFTGYKVLRMGDVKLLTGAVLRYDTDPGKQLPIANAHVSLKEGLSEKAATSNGSGLFRLRVKDGIQRGDSVILEVRHPDYQPVDTIEHVADRPYLIRMIPLRTEAQLGIGEPATVTNVRIRYGVKSQNTVTIGSAVKVFQVVNRSDIPCGRKEPCSPDHKWKASVGGASLDAGDRNVFEHARVTCIAGPCPFTKIEKDSFSAGGSHIGVLVRNWSDTATFVLEAGVVHSSVYDQVLQTFPVILGQSMSFTLPDAAQGPSVEATVNGEYIVYPLGPDLTLSWADCDMQTMPGPYRLFRCVVRPGYRFR